MARSRRKHPFCGWTTAASDKQFKVLAHRAYRRAIHQALVTGRDLPEDKHYGNPIGSPKDGKQRWLDEECYRK